LTGFIDKSTVEFKFDTLLCFNTTLDKMLTIRLGRQLLPIGKLDAMTYYYGVKITNKWYFFSGPVLFVERMDLSKPTSFSELHQTALEQVFRGCLKKSPKGEWEINDKFFSDLTGGGICYECKTQEDFNKVYLEVVNRNWQHESYYCLIL